MKTGNAMERLELRIERIPFSGCWIFMGGLSKSGYGQIFVNKKNVRTHRVAFAAYKGSIPEGSEIDHLCRVRSCCNPAHLEAVSRKENYHRGVKVDPPLAQQNRAKTHCSRGHAYVGANLYSYKGARICKSCSAYRNRKGVATSRIGGIKSH